MNRPSIVMSVVAQDARSSVVPAEKLRAGVETAPGSAMSSSVKRSSCTTMLSSRCATVRRRRSPRPRRGLEHPGNGNPGRCSFGSLPTLPRPCPQLEAPVLRVRPTISALPRRVAARRLQPMLTRQRTHGEQCEWREAKTHRRPACCVPLNQCVHGLNSTLRRRVCELYGDD